MIRCRTIMLALTIHRVHAVPHQSKRGQTITYHNLGEIDGGRSRTKLRPNICPIVILHLTQRRVTIAMSSFSTNWAVNHRLVDE